MEVVISESTQSVSVDGTGRFVAHGSSFFSEQARLTAIIVKINYATVYIYKAHVKQIANATQGHLKKTASKICGGVKMTQWCMPAWV